jgi:hypothetical protein
MLGSMLTYGWAGPDGQIREYISERYLHSLCCFYSFIIWRYVHITPYVFRREKKFLSLLSQNGRFWSSDAREYIFYKTCIQDIYICIPINSTYNFQSTMGKSSNCNKTKRKYKQATRTAIFIKECSV